jgi:hypothetical protein
MSSSDSAVFGIYGKADAAGTAIDLLLSKGFSVSEISVVLPGNEVTRAFVHRTTKAAEGGTDDIVRGFPHLESPGEFEVSDLGLLIAAGPMMTTLTGLVAGGSHGGLTGVFIGIGIPEYEARLYEAAVKDGGCLLSVHCGESNRMSHAKNALEDTGAEGIASTIEAISDDAASEDFGSISAQETREQTERAIASPSTLKFKPDPA